MLRVLTVVALATFLLAPACSKKDDAPASTADTPSPSGSGERRDRPHEWDGGAHGDHGEHPPR